MAITRGLSSSFLRRFFTDLLADAGQHFTELQEAVVFCFIAHRGPAGVIAVLSPAKGVYAGRLQMTVLIWTDPDILPCGRQHQLADALLTSALLRFLLPAAKRLLLLVVPVALEGLEVAAAQAELAGPGVDGLVGELAAIREAGLDVEDVEMRKADLEDVFIDLMAGEQTPLEVAR